MQRIVVILTALAFAQVAGHAPRSTSEPQSLVGINHPEVARGPSEGVVQQGDVGSPGELSPAAVLPLEADPIQPGSSDTTADRADDDDRAGSVPAGDARGAVRDPAGAPFGQPALTAEPSRMDDEAPSGAAQPAARRKSPTDMIAEAIRRSDEGESAGRPLTLLEALSSVRGTDGQLRVTHAYWQAATAMAEYRLSVAYCERMARIDARPEDAATFRTAQASAAAALRIAESAASAARHRLAEAAMLRATEALPRPVDLPHVGPYYTRFREVFSLRHPPAQAWLIDRKLPIRRRLIDARASAFQAAEDASQAAIDAYRLGKGGMAEVLSSFAQSDAQYRALLRSARDYNHDIADYALSVAGPQNDEQTLVAMLIKPGRDAPRVRRGPSGSSRRAARSGPARPAVGLAPSRELTATSDNRNPTAEASEARIAASAGASSDIARPPAAPSDVRPATFDAATPNSGDRPATLSPEPEELQPLGRQTPTLAPPEESVLARPAGRAASVAPSGRLGRPVTEGSTAGWPRQSEAVPQRGLTGASLRSAASHPTSSLQAAEPELQQQPIVPVPGGPAATASGPAHKPAPANSSLLDRAPGLYPALLEVDPAARVEHLAVALHQNRTLPKHAQEPIAIEGCLTGLVGVEGRAVVAAYWLAAQRAAEYQTLVAETDMLEQLVPLALAHRDEPLGAEAMLRLRAARLAAHADVLDAELDLLDAQFQLTRRVGRPPDSPWLLPATIPYAGPDPLALGTLAHPLADSWPVRRLAVAVPRRRQYLEERAAAVVEADAGRAAATAAYQAGGQSIDQALSWIRRQTEETSAFLVALTEYNEAIAAYAAAVLPPTVPGDQLARLLVGDKATKSKGSR